MMLIAAGLSLAAVLAQSPIGESFEPKRRPRGASPSPPSEAIVEVAPSLYPPAPSRNRQPEQSAPDHTKPLPADGQAQIGNAGPVCHMRVVPVDPATDPKIAITVPADRDYKIRSITPDCLK